MTVRKELFLAVLEKLQLIEALEKVTLFRNQKNEDWTAAFIRVKAIKWESMVENRQEGNAVVDVYFMCRDGWMDQHHMTEDPEGGLMEVDLIDAIVENLQFLSGENFKKLELSDEEDEDITQKGQMRYRLSFETEVYRQVNYPYTKKKLNLNTN